MLNEDKLVRLHFPRDEPSPGLAYSNGPDQGGLEPFDPRTVRDQKGLLLLLATCAIAPLVIVLIGWAAYSLGNDRNRPPPVAAAESQPVQAASAPAATPAQVAAANPSPPAPEAVAGAAPAGPASSAAQGQPSGAPAADPAPAASPGADQWVVQLASIQQDADAVALQAQALWSQLTAAHPDLMAGARLDIRQADLGDRGVFFRIRAAGFATKDAADRFCAEIKSGGRDCFTARP